MNLLKRLGLGLTPEERAEREKARAEEIARRDFYKKLAAEGEYVEDVIRRRLVELEICYRYKKLDKRGIWAPEVRPINFREIYATPEAHYLCVETRSMPRGVTIAHLRDEKVVESLGYSIGTEVSCKFTKEIGFWYVVPRKGRLGGIRNFVRYADALAELPQQAPRLAYPVGFGENAKYIWDDLEENANLLVGGPKGSGKSNCLNMILSTLIQRTTPEDLRLFLIDMKGGMEFAFYKGIPHLGGDVPYKDPETKEEKPPLGQKVIKHGPQVIQALEYVRKELERRAHMLEGKVRKVSTWNKRYRNNRLSYWVVVIDELAALMLDDRYRNDANKLLADIGARGRAVGIFLIVATQVPNSEVVTRLLKGNMDTRLAFRCADGPSSMIMVDNYDATYLPKIPGRVLSVGGHNTHGERTEIQTPYMPDDLVRDIVARVKGADMQYAADLPKHDVTTAELFKFALSNGGSFSERDTWPEFKKRGLTRDEFRAIGQQWELKEPEGHDPRIEIDDDIYHLAPGSGTAPRLLVRCAHCAENPLEGGDADGSESLTETLEKPADTPENSLTTELTPTLTPTDTHTEGDSDGIERDSETEAHKSNGNGASRDVDGDGNGAGDLAELENWIDSYYQPGRPDAR